jgi:hypothetical protein
MPSSGSRRAKVVAGSISHDPHIGRAATKLELTTTRYCDYGFVDAN